MKTFGYGSVRRLLQIDDPEDFFGYILKHDGIWLPRSTDERYRDDVRTVEYDFVNGELVEKEQEPYPFEDHDPSKPVLPLPCSQGELRVFLEHSGLDSMLPPGHEILKYVPGGSDGKTEEENPPRMGADQHRSGRGEAGDAVRPFEDPTALLKLFIADIARRLYERDGHFPNYRKVFLQLRADANKSDQVGEIITAVHLTEGVSPESVRGQLAPLGFSPRTLFASNLTFSFAA